MLEKLRREFTELRSDMAALARENGRLRDDYATTLLFVMCHVVKGTTYLLQIGDGAIVAGKPWRLAFPPHRGPSRCYTRFVTDPDAMSHVHVAQLPTPPDTIVMLSDGLTDITMNERELTLHEPFYDFVDDLMRKPESRPLEGDVTSLMTSLIDGPDVRSMTADDTSLVVFSRIPILRPVLRPW